MFTMVFPHTVGSFGRRRCGNFVFPVLYCPAFLFQFGFSVSLTLYAVTYLTGTHTNEAILFLGMVLWGFGRVEQRLPTPNDYLTPIIQPILHTSWCYCLFCCGLIPRAFLQQHCARDETSSTYNSILDCMRRRLGLQI